MKILIIKLRAMGDTVITTASINAVREALSDIDSSVEIHCMVPKSWASLLAHHPNCNKVLSWDKSSNKIMNILSWGLKLRKEKYDMVVALHASTTTAWLAKLSGCENRSVHFHGAKDKNLFSKVKIAGKGKIQPIIARDFDTLKAIPELSQLGKMEKRIKTSIELTEKEQAWAESFLCKTEKKPVLAIGLGASRASKIWPVERFAELSRFWVKEKKGIVLVFISPKEKELAEPLAHIENVTVLSDVSLREMSALLQISDLFVGNDSGPKHLAVAVGTRTVTLFGPENPYEWHPYDRKEHPIIFIEEMSCRKAPIPGWTPWCGVEYCVKEKHRCMRDISVNEVKKICQL